MQRFGKDRQREHIVKLNNEVEIRVEMFVCE